MKQLDRRQLVEFGGAALLATGLGVRPGLPAGGQPRRRNIKKALKIGMIQLEGSLTDKFRAVADLGFDGVEMDSPNELTSDEVLAAKEASGLEIPGVVDSVHWSDTLGDPDPQVRARGVAGLETALRDAKTYGASTVLLVPAVVR